jgi:large subunit ribosomal protein L16
MKRAGRVWIRIFPDVPVSKKPTEVRMGKGKGTPEFWACRVKPGRIMFEIDGVPSARARGAALGAAKLPIKTRFVSASRTRVEEEHQDADEGSDIRP